MTEGFLVKTSIGRYAIDGHPKYELTSKDCLEVNINGVWEQTRVEFSHRVKDYILVNGYPIENAMVRVSS